MREYIVYLTDPADTTIILAKDIEDAKEMAFELYDYERVVRITLYIFVGVACEPI